MKLTLIPALMLLCLLASSSAAVSLLESSPLHGLSFEVVRLRRPAATLASHAAGAHPAETTLEVRALGGEHSIRLRRNDRLVAPGMRTIATAPDGRVTSSAEGHEACFYQGAAGGSGPVAFNLCGRGVKGFFHSEEHGAVAVEPAHLHLAAEHVQAAGGEAEAHVVFRVQEERPDGWCGVEDGHDHHHAHPAARAEALAAGEGHRHVSPAATDLEVRMIIFSDEARVARLGAGTATNTLEMANAAQAYYTNAAENSDFDYDIALTVVAMFEWADGDPYTVSDAACCDDVKDINDMLDKFQDNVLTNSSLTQSISFDNAYLLTGFDVGNSNSSGTVGLASVGQMCSGSQSSSGLVETIPSFSDTFHAVTLAHELGHNFDMQHDTLACVPSTNGIMSVSSSASDPPTVFSDCSRDYFNSFLATAGNRLCLEDALPAAPASVCGDGRVTGTEECDCGFETCNCCTAACTFEASATCSDNDPCCDASTCTPLTAGTVCRAAADAECDLAEVCNGTVGSCPSDVFRGGGVSCGTGSLGACFAGSCVEPEAECMNLAGQETSCPYRTAVALASQLSTTYCARQSCQTAAQEGSTSCGVFTTQWPDGVPCAGATDASSQCVDGTCVTAAAAAEAALASSGAGITVTAEFSNYTECNCSVQTRTLERCVTGDGEVVDDSVCQPYTLQRTCVDAVVNPDCPSDACADGEIDVPSAGCTAENTVYGAAAGIGVVVLLFLYCCCCRSKKPKVDDSSAELTRYR